MTSELNPPQNPLGSEKIGRLLIRFAVPTVISLLVNSLYNMVDQIFIGWGVGTLGNSATNVIFPLVLLVSAVAVLFGDGGAAYMSLQLGKGESAKAQKGANTSIVLLAIAAVVLFAALFIFLNPIVNALGATPDNLKYAMAYGRIIVIGFPFVLVTIGMSSLIRADGSPNLTMIILLAGAILNIGLDAMFVIGFGWGMVGAAWATVIGQVVSFAICLWYIPRFKTVKIARGNISRKLVRRIAALGVSSTITVVAIAVVSTLGNNLLRHYGADSVYGADIPLAAFGIVMKVTSIFTSVMAGIAIGCNPIFGYNYGAANYGRVKKTFTFAAISATVVAVLCFVATEVFPVAATNLFGNNGDLYMEFSVKAFRVFNVLCILNGFHTVVCIFFQAIGKPIQSIICTLARQIIFYIPLTLIASASLVGVWGVAYAAPVADAFAFLIALILIVREVGKINSKQNAVDNAESNMVFEGIAVAPLARKVVITIGRENGSGGRYVGDLLAKSLGISCYDKEIVAQASEKSGLARKFIEQYEESQSELSVFGGMQLFPVQIAKAEAETIREIAAQEACVFVGRHSDYVLRERDDVINIFVHASLDTRIKRVSKRSKISEKQAETIIKKKDRERAAYYNYHTDTQWGFASNYHMSVDTGAVGIEGAAELIRGFVEQKLKKGA
jgi:putative MATE family efflux protein